MVNKMYGAIYFKEYDNVNSLRKFNTVCQFFSVFDDFLMINYKCATGSCKFNMVDHKSAAYKYNELVDYWYTIEFWTFDRGILL